MYKNTYSFSRINAFSTCPAMWQMQYIEKRKSADNWMALAGTLGHDLLEKYDKGELKAEELSSQWEARYEDEVLKDFLVPDWEKKWYKECVASFGNFKGFDYPAEWIEEEFEIELPKFRLNGIVDRLSKEDNDLVMTDHKISNPFSGKILNEKLRQMYLYSFAVKEYYGKFPDYLEFNFFRKGVAKRYKFQEEMVEESLEWAEREVEKIEAEEDFPFTPSHFFCGNLCNFRNICKYGMKA